MLFARLRVTPEQRGIHTLSIAMFLFLVRISLIFVREVGDSYMSRTLMI
jgi:hypothetical protein